MLMLSLIQLPAGFAGQVASNTTALLSDFAPYITLILGVLLGTLAISILIGSLHK